MKTVNVSSLKNNPSEALRYAHEDMVLVMNRDQPDALMIGLNQTGGMLDMPGVRTALATSLFKDSTLSLARSARLANMVLADFIAHVSRLGIPVINQTAAEANQDMDTLEQWLAFVIADASPLIGLAIVDGLPWLPHLFGEVWLPEIVRNEVLPGKQARGEPAIQAALSAGWLRVWEHPLPALTGIDLDEGESACISLALHHPDPVLLIMDERAGRAVALEKGLTITGTAAIIGMAKQRGLIPAARPVFETLHQADFRIAAAVIRQILTRIGE